MSDDGILKFSNAGGVTSLTRYPNFLTNYGDFGALQRIAYQSLSANQAAFNFNNIPQIYQDLLVVGFIRSTNTPTTDGIAAFCNADTTTTNYSSTSLVGNGSTATSSRTTSQFGFQGTTAAAGATSGIYTAFVWHILNYASTALHKTAIFRGATDLNGSGETRLSVSNWHNASIQGINSLIFQNGAQFAAGSSIEIYGVKASNA